MEPPPVKPFFKLKICVFTFFGDKKVNCCQKVANCLIAHHMLQVWLRKLLISALFRQNVIVNKIQYGGHLGRHFG